MPALIASLRKLAPWGTSISFFSLMNLTIGMELDRNRGLRGTTISAYFINVPRLPWGAKTEKIATRTQHMDKKFTKHQQKIIKNYYENREAISLQRLSELVTELY